MFIIIKKRIYVTIFFILYFILKMFESSDENDETDVTTWIRRIMK
jgi:hypothetical protein